MCLFWCLSLLWIFFVWKIIYHFAFLTYAVPKQWSLSVPQSVCSSESAIRTIKIVTARCKCPATRLRGWIVWNLHTFFCVSFPFLLNCRYFFLQIIMDQSSVLLVSVRLMFFVKNLVTCLLKWDPWNPCSCVPSELYGTFEANAWREIYGHEIKDMCHSWQCGFQCVSFLATCNLNWLECQTDDTKKFDKKLGDHTKGNKNAFQQSDFFCDKNILLRGQEI